MRSKIIAFSGTLKRIIEEKSRSLMVVKLRLFLSTSKIFPIVISSGLCLPLMRIKYAAACGGMLLVKAEETAALMVIPSLKEFAVTGEPFALRIMVRGLTISLRVCSSGVGSHSCGPELMDKYKLNEKIIKFGFTLNVK